MKVKNYITGLFSPLNAHTLNESLNYETDVDINPGCAATICL